MSDATERIRAMLDERGVEHFDGTETTLWGYEPTGDSTGAYRFAADETSGGCMQVRMFNISPEQAIEATLGRGECGAEVEVVEFSQMQEIHRFTCSECGESFGAEEHGGLFGLVLDKVKLPNYCPSCGRKVRA